jgi:cbb3-type cytochrome oxidase maturation protein
MAPGLWVIVGWSAFVIFTGIVAFIWGWKNGQFRNIEEAKYRMLEDREPEPWPDAKSTGGDASKDEPEDNHG